LVARPCLGRPCDRGGRGDQRHPWLARRDVGVFGIVFGPGRITAHRVRGAILLYLSIAVVFAWLNRLIAEAAPSGFFGLKFIAGQHGALISYLYCSLTSLTTLGFGDITPVNAFARSLTVLEALLGQLFPAVVLARILTLYTDDKHREETRSEGTALSEKGA